MTKNLFTDEEMKCDETAQERKKKQTYKEYCVEQSELKYLDTFDSMVPPDHIARIINAVVDSMDISAIMNKYRGGGASAYDPSCLLKVWLLGYSDCIYTSRRLEKQLHENIAYMWISGNQRPDFRTLNNFRLKLEDDMKTIFRQVVTMAMTLGVIDGKEGFVDGTFIGAYANRHKIVWKKSVSRMIKKIEPELDTLVKTIFDHAKNLQILEDEEYGEKSALGVHNRTPTAEEAEVIAAAIVKHLKGKRGKTEGEKASYDSAKRLQELDERKKVYEKKQQTLAGRNSYSSTDQSATAMMDKEGVIRAGYTEVVIAQNQIALDYAVGNTGERRLFDDVVVGAEGNTGSSLEAVVADGNFGDEENYSFLEERNISGYVKHNHYYIETNTKYNEEHVGHSQFKRSEEKDAYVCPQGKELTLSSERTETMPSGYEKKTKIYSAKECDCMQCIVKEKCTKSSARRLSISEVYERQKTKARQLLESERGKKLSRRRGHEIESIFGERKFNRRNRHYFLRGLGKVGIESGLFYTAHNIRKLWCYIKERIRSKINSQSEMVFGRMKMIGLETGI